MKKVSAQVKDNCNVTSLSLRGKYIKVGSVIVHLGIVVGDKLTYQDPRGGKAPQKCVVVVLVVAAVVVIHLNYFLALTSKNYSYQMLLSRLV